ncbi:protein of unknown function [Candidatus Filomicrobium marinum]|uniref:Uncharacterized protein n=1 Tax=Candidatus Filomicrobium marinum TaxID=1608628 RepID=A0A0D6JHV5_9HYPH|nr:protein of unknown function [Candidatus Filomicrobium marinum]CPR21331.1 protein of unknown function [Candidatus Filomicrobium marinum]
MDLTCHSIIGSPSAFATSSARTVFPVPGSPLMSSGRSNMMAAFTAIRRSSVATYDELPSNFMVIPYMGRFPTIGAASLVNSTFMTQLEKTPPPRNTQNASAAGEHATKGSPACEGEGRKIP